MSDLDPVAEAFALLLAAIVDLEDDDPWSLPDTRAALDVLAVRLRETEQERDRAIHIMECADTPLMRDVLAERDSLAAVSRTLREAATALYEFMWNERETHEPPREMLDEGWVACENIATYERTEELVKTLGAALDSLRSGQAAKQESDPTEGLPSDLKRVLRDQSVIVPQDQSVFELISRWQNAPSDTASASPIPGGIRPPYTFDGSVPRSDEELVRDALRRLNPEFHESDSSWGALDRLLARPAVEAPDRDGASETDDDDGEDIYVHGSVA